jgi:hypothetical protein
VKAFLAAILVVLVATTAQADTLVVGLFTPSAPFPSTAARVELANKLGEHLGKALNESGSGRNYARAGDYQAAVKKGDISVALVDATYLAVAGGSYTILAGATRGGDTSHQWQLVARGGAANITALKGKRILVPSIGGRESDFVINALFSGDVAKDFFGKIEPAPDTASTLAALGLGKADAAVVPVGVTLPQGTTSVVTLPALPGEVLVAYGSVTAQQRQALAAAAASFSGDASIGGFKAVDADTVKSVSRRFSVPVKRGPHVVPNVRLVVGDLVDGRTFTIERTPITQYAAPAK